MQIKQSAINDQIIRFFIFHYVRFICVLKKLYKSRIYAYDKNNMFKWHIQVTYFLEHACITYVSDYLSQRVVNEMWLLLRGGLCRESNWRKEVDVHASVIWPRLISSIHDENLKRVVSSCVFLRSTILSHGWSSVRATTELILQIRINVS